MTELMPCPFCGGKAKLYSIGTGSPHYGYYHQVVCQGCLTASGAYWSGEQSAIDAWNTRAAYKETRHVKPRTVEDVLREFEAEVESCNNTYETEQRYAELIERMVRDA